MQEGKGAVTDRSGDSGRRKNVDASVQKRTDSPQSALI